jgi:enoyl-CoA hydratase/carnithine racemase
MSEPLVIVQNNLGIYTVTINRPDSMNSLSFPALIELSDATKIIAADADARCVVITGAGDKAFSSGADLKERAGMNDEQVREYIRTIRETFTLIENLPIPAIAAVNGIALGGGTELALSCDIRLISDRASMGLTETSLAIIPGAGGTQRLPRLIGKARAKELIFMAKRVNAAEALAIGLANQVVPHEHLLEEALSMAKAIAGNGPVAVRAAKKAINTGCEMPLDGALKFESECYWAVIPTEDRQEALAAFREKRKPSFRGR